MHLNSKTCIGINKMPRSDGQLDGSTDFYYANESFTRRSCHASATLQSMLDLLDEGNGQAS